MLSLTLALTWSPPAADPIAPDAAHVAQRFRDHRHNVETSHSRQLRSFALRRRRRRRRRSRAQPTTPTLLHPMTVSGRHSPMSALSHAHIAHALLASPDEGQTLDFGHTGISDLPEDAANELASAGKRHADDDSPVSRIALGYNSLTTLPMAFALLSRLRYLNLRSNAFFTFPDVLTIMPALEILDISRNKLKRMPSKPGTLLNLQVLHIGRNRLTKLPYYLAEFHKLHVLRIDHNPLEWPPRDVIERPSGAEDREGMARWLDNLRRWVADHSPAKRTALDSVDLMSDEEGVPLSPFEHSRSFSIESIGSQYSTSSSLPPSPRQEHLAPLKLPRSLTSSRSASPSVSSDLSLATPDAYEDDERMHQHARNASYSIGAATKPLNIALLPKKSLPDLRGLKTRPKIPMHYHSEEEHGMPPFPTIRPVDSGLVSPPSASSPPDHSAPAMDTERNSYFRRLSTLTPSSKAVPQALLVVVDAVRGIFFALSQVYSALRHYTVNVIDERLSGVFGKVLDPASTYLSYLIAALDRFDSLSRRGTPPPSVCRGVLESCKDSVAVFGKVVGVLQLQLKVLAGSEDVRYTRSLLLMIYGSMGEVSNAWGTIIPHLDALQPLLRDQNPPPSKSAQPSARSPIPSSSRPPVPTRDETQPPIPRAQMPSASSLAFALRARSRRNGGSFSAKDVQMGRAMMPQPSGPPPTAPLPPMPSTAPLRSALRNPLATAGPGGSGAGFPSPALPPIPASAPYSHSRENSQTIGPLMVAQAASARGGGGDLPSDSSKLVDQDLLLTMDTATDAARTVWTMMDHALEEDQEELRDSLRSAQVLTAALKGDIRDVLAGRGDSKVLVERATLFLNTVVHLLKIFAEGHPLSPSLRSNIARLTQSTQDFAILLHVSSFTPASTSRTTPAPTISTTGLLAPPGDEGGPRSASAAQPRSRPGAMLNGLPTKPSMYKDAPWSAMPLQQSFKVPTPPRSRHGAHNRFEDIMEKEGS